MIERLIAGETKKWRLNHISWPSIQAFLQHSAYRYSRFATVRMPHEEAGARPRQ